ncbi:hypothetical protein QBC38DRAFT_238728 [Podospora fimiseda]|uniref:Mid2 domain-containing protein n=1 Tax=Podospora fimiseda TaxID=252190 RepID=A0AAN7BMM9_9PEZI|nr:hypothetical protein QBC38DRAFT_238728 [Podospora fimiseda]
MPGSRLTLRFATLTLFVGLTLAIPATEIFKRQDTCLQNFKPCAGSGLPGFFCCPNDQICVVLAASTTILCCPQGRSCKKIRPLACDISLQDGQKNPDAIVKTTALKGTLTRCGQECCPFGYNCEDGQCVMNANQNVAPSQSGISSSTRTPTSTSSPTTTGTRTGGTTTPTGTKSADNDSTTTATPQQQTGPPIAGIAGGAAAGAVILIIIAVIAFIFLRKRKSASNSKSGSPLKLSRSTSSFGNIISGPIVQENSTIRTDFARVVPPPQDNNDQGGSVTGAMLDSDSMFYSPPQQPNAARLSSVAYGSPPTYPDPYARMPTMPNDVDDYYEDMYPPQTPRRGNPREPSSVSINVFADPNITPDRTPETGKGDDTRRYTDMTTFTRMLDSADLSGVARGEPYVYGQGPGGR